MPFPIDVTWIKATEAKLGLSFPLGFVARMVKENGGEVQAAGDVWNLYPFLDKSDRTRLKRTCNDIVLETSKARAWPGFPASGVAIAGNGSADQLLLLPDPAAPEKLQAGVFFWDHETGKVTEVASDFTEVTPPSPHRQIVGDPRRRPTKG